MPARAGRSTGSPRPSKPYRCALIAVLVLSAVSCASTKRMQTRQTEHQELRSDSSENRVSRSETTNLTTKTDNLLETWESMWMVLPLDSNGSKTLLQRSTHWKTQSSSESDSSRQVQADTVVRKVSEERKNDVRTVQNEDASTIPVWLKISLTCLVAVNLILFYLLKRQKRN